MTKIIDFAYLNENGKRVAGAAAFAHHVYTEAGGVQAYNDEVGAEYIREFINEHSDIISERLERNAKKKRFKAV